MDVPIAPVTTLPAMRPPLVLLVVALLGGCPAGEGVVEDGSRDGSLDGGELRACATSADCPRPLSCAGGRCVAPDATTMDTRPTGVDGSAMEASTAPEGGLPPLDGEACARARGTPGRLPVDVIVLVDQSASTGEEAAAIQANINTSLGNVLAASGLDYRVILINSDTTRLCPGPPLGDPARCGESNPPRYYRVLHPVNNSDELTLLLWTYDGDGKRPNACHRLRRMVPAWRDYLRFESIKVFIVFSDDDPTSYGRNPGPPICPSRLPGAPFPGCADADCLSVAGTSTNCGTRCPNFGCPTYADRPADWGGADFPTELYRLEPRRSVRGALENPFGSPANPRWVLHALIGVARRLEPAEPATDRCDTCAAGGNTAENAGATYQALARLTGGVRFPSCDTDYSPVFRRIASTLAPIACEFRLESTGLGAIDPARTNVLYYPAGGAVAETLPRDDSRACDTGANGWQFVADRTRVRVCGAACERIQADPRARVEIQVGCETLRCPPDCIDAGTASVRDGATGDGPRPDGVARDGGCVPEICDNGVDDDCDGLVDRQDRDCVAVPP